MKERFKMSLDRKFNFHISAPSTFIDTFAIPFYLIGFVGTFILYYPVFIFMYFNNFVKGEKKE